MSLCKNNNKYVEILKIILLPCPLASRYYHILRVCIYRGVSVVLGVFLLNRETLYLHAACTNGYWYVLVCMIPCIIPGIYQYHQWSQVLKMLNVVTVLAAQAFVCSVVVDCHLLGAWTPYHTRHHMLRVTVLQQYTRRILTSYLVPAVPGPVVSYVRMASDPGIRYTSVLPVFVQQIELSRLAQERQFGTVSWALLVLVAQRHCSHSTFHRPNPINRVPGRDCLEPGLCIRRVPVVQLRYNVRVPDTSRTRTSYVSYPIPDTPTDRSIHYIAILVQSRIIVGK